MFGRKKNDEGLNRSRDRLRAGSERPKAQSVSYYRSASNKDNEAVKSKKDSPNRPYSIFRLSPAVLAVIVIIGSILFSLTLSSSANVTVFNDKPSPYRNQSEYSKKVKQLLDDDLLNKTKFTVSSDEVERRLMEAYPELDSVLLRLPVLGRKPTLVVSIRQPALVLATNTGGGVIVDSSGVAAADIKQLPSSEKQKLPVVIDESGVELKVGQRVLPSETINFILDAKAQIDAKNLKISKMNLPVRVNELDIYIEGLNYYVKTDASTDSRTQLGSFFATKNYLDSNNISPAEYVDVRVEEKVFYK